MVLINSSVDVRALRNFDGKGICEEICVLGKDSNEDTGTITEEDMRKLAQTIDWGVTVIETLTTIHRNKQSKLSKYYEDEDTDYEYDEDEDI